MTSEIPYVRIGLMGGGFGVLNAILPVIFAELVWNGAQVSIPRLGIHGMAGALTWLIIARIAKTKWTRFGACFVGFVSPFVGLVISLGLTAGYVLAFWFTTFPIGVVAGLAINCYLPEAPIPGKCIVCSYDLTGNVSGKCPECGEQIGEHLRA